jgi:hypothetical protein
MRVFKLASSSTKVPEPAVRRRDGSTDMMSAPAPTIQDLASVRRPSSRARPIEDSRVRLRLKPKAPTTGWVDGGWWPRSRDLAAELPGLLSVLAVRLGRIERVSYHLGEWGPTLHRISWGGGVVRLEGYRSQRANTVDVLALEQRVTLLVVAPEVVRADRARGVDGGRASRQRPRHRHSAPVPPDSDRGPQAATMTRSTQR